MTATLNHPEHVADLQRSGLSGDVLTRLALSDVRPHDLKVSGVRSGYRIPFFSIDGAPIDFERIRLFPPVKTSDGHTQKYFQAHGTDPHAYFPPLLDWRAVCLDPNTALLITEGEKKSAAACHAGLTTIGIAGVWCWRVKLDSGSRMTLAELDQFVWKGRCVGIVPDSDAWRAEKGQDVLSGFFALAMDLARRGAVVRFVQLEELAGQKVGLDDWLVKAGPWPLESWKSLETIELGNPRLKDLHAWWQRWHLRQAEAEQEENADTAHPEIERIGSLIEARWPQLGVSITLDRLSEKSGKVNGELTVRLIGGKTLIPLVDLNLKSGITRTKTARELADKHPSVPWQAVLDALCTRAITVIREGEPLLHIAAHVEVEPLDFRLHPIVQDGRPSVIFAPPGASKSLFSLVSGLTVDAGASIAKLQGRSGRVAYLDYEAEHADHVSRAARLRFGHPELLNTDLFYWRCARPLYELLPQIQRLIVQHSIKLVIIDSLAPACGGDLYASEAPIRFFSALRQLKVASLSIAHCSKAGDEDKKTVYGSVFFEAFARSCFELKKLQDTESNELKVGLFHKKENNAAMQSPLGFHVTFGSGVIRYESFDVAGEPEFGSALPLRAQIEQALSGKPKTVNDLATELDKPAKLIRNCLNNARDKHFVQLDKTNGEYRWGVLSKR